MMSTRFQHQKVHYSLSPYGRSLVVAWLLVGFCQFVHSQQTSACSPSNSTPPLPCTASQWVRVIGEFYAPRATGGGASSVCQVDPTSACNTALFSAGLQPHCNGPVGAEPCQEMVDMEGARERAQCLGNITEVAALVQYSCVKETDIFDLCDTTRQLTSDFSSSFQMVYLASPGFPASSSSGQLCSCTLQGSRLRVQAVQVTVAARLPWQSDVTEGSDYEAVLSIRGQGGTTLFKSNECVGCTRVDSINTILVSTGLQTVSEMTITYSDFGLQHQNVWLEITELGPDLNISCGSTPLPMDRIVTTTTTSTTATTSAAAASTLATTAAKPGPVATPPDPTTQRTTSKTNTGGRPGGAGRQPRNDNSSGGSGDSSTVVVLVVVLVLLLVAGAILGFILYRRRGQCGADGKKGVKPMVQAWFRDLECCACLQKLTPRPDPDHDAEHAAGVDGVNFDNAAVASGGVDPADIGPTHQPHGGDGHNPRYSKHKQRRRNVTTVPSEDGELTIIQNQVYQSHRELVEGEVARMKQTKREQRAQDVNRTLGNTETLDPSLPSDAVAGKATSLDTQTNKLDVGTRHLDHLGQDSHSGGLPEQDYAVIGDYEPVDYNLEQNPSSRPVDKGFVQDRGYGNSKAVNDATSHRKHKALKEETPYSNDANPSASRHTQPPHRASDSATNISVESSGDVQPPGNMDSDKLPGSRDLLSPEERNMFAALGLSGDTLNPSPSATTSDTAQTGSEDLSLQPISQPGATERSNGLSENSEELYSRVKPNRAPKPELVSDILELPLRNNKGQRRGHDSDGGSDARDSDSREREENYLGSQGDQVQMSEC